MTSIQKVGVIEKGCDATAGYDHYISGDYLFVGDDAQEMVYVYYLKNQEVDPGNPVTEQSLSHKALKFLYIKHHLYVFGKGDLTSLEISQQVLLENDLLTWKIFFRFDKFFFNTNKKTFKSFILDF